jgi:hypothetical protein
MFHLQQINNSFLADLRTRFIENAFMIKPEVVSITLPERQNLLKEALLILHIFSLSLANMQDSTNVSISPPTSKLQHKERRLSKAKTKDNLTVALTVAESPHRRHHNQGRTLSSSFYPPSMQRQHIYLPRFFNSSQHTNSH